MISDMTLATKYQASCKKEKTRITDIVSFNIDKSDKISHWLIKKLKIL